jgi:hypothetical protein
MSRGEVDRHETGKSVARGRAMARAFLATPGFEAAQQSGRPDPVRGGEAHWPPAHDAIAQDMMALYGSLKI